LLPAVLLLLIGATLLVSERVFPTVFTMQKTNAQRVSKWLPQGSLEKAGLQAEDLVAFLKDENAAVLVGRVLYPRFYPANKGEPDRFSAFSNRSYPRLVFEMIGPNLEKGVVLPMTNSPDSFPQGIDAVVLGCSTKLGVDAIVVVAIHPEVKVYVRSPVVSLVCPASLPTGVQR
jgi:hypothetical protein